MIAKRIYSTLQRYFPGYSNNAIGEAIGVGGTTISKLSHGEGIGLPAAEWLAKHKGHTELLAEAQKETERCNLSRANKMNRKTRKFKLSHLSPEMQVFLGYVGI